MWPFSYKKLSTVNLVLRTKFNVRTFPNITNLNTWTITLLSFVIEKSLNDYKVNKTKLKNQDL